MRWLVLFAVACGGKAPRLPVANHTTTPARHDCSEAIVDELAQVLAARWHVEKLELRCASGRFGAEGYFIEARHEDTRRTGIVDASGAELVAFIDEPPLAAGTFINGYQAVDLDDDGEDEIVESWRRTGGAMGSDNWLVVRWVANRAFARVHGPFLSCYHPELGGCSATWELAAGSIIVVVEQLPGIPPSACLPPGRHRFALHDGEVIEARR